MDEPVWAPTVFTQESRANPESGDRAHLLSRRRGAGDPLMSDDRDGDGGDFRGQERNNDTHASKTDPDARLNRKSNGAESRLAYLGHLLIENRHGLIADAMTKTAEREAGLLMLLAQWQRAPGHRTVGADEAYDVREFIEPHARVGRPRTSHRISRVRAAARSTVGPHDTRAMR